MGAIDPNFFYRDKFPKLLEHYELIKEIGKGGQATVFQCRSRSGSRRGFACKSIAKGLNDVDQFSRLKDLRLEVDVMRKLSSSSGVVALKEVIVDESFWHLIMELCECSLYDRIESQGRLCEKEAALLIRSLARIVQDLHSTGVVHRDLKPGNVLITLGGKCYDVKVADFGFSVLFSGPSAPCFTEELGTPRYYAPEVLQGSYSKEVDIWGLGVILYEALTGMLAFSDLDNEEIVSKLRKGEDLTISCLDWASVLISENARHLVLSMMQLRPENRLSLEGILSHPWVVEHAGSITTNEETCVSNHPCTRNDAKNKIKLQRVNGEWRLSSRFHRPEQITHGIKPERQKSTEAERGLHRKRGCNENIRRQEVVPKRIKLQMLNGTWTVVKPCALVC